ncbi:Chitin-binding lectin 1-like [Heracleum sosnowskyi]|uniref:Chitin-binding lectin 1-like n=1 Tax=Heracleum sosnowskyi TaxID=360622 RepID=A0AAD8N6X1_9APIA|nr:Chitin-binding lectin 1-like [Heracleum sosnowskyi]
MVLNTVSLECSSCLKKVKKVLCKFPKIRDQVYDVKNSKVTIKVLCCNPEKIRDKICSKAGKVVKSIQIVDDTEKPKAPEKPKEAEKPKVPEKPKEAEEPKVPEAPGPVQGYPSMPMYPNGACYGPCCQGYGGGPGYQGYGQPVPPPPGPCYHHGQPVPPPGPSYDYGYGYRGSKCCVNTDFFSDENPQACTIM